MSDHCKLYAVQHYSEEGTVPTLEEPLPQSNAIHRWWTNKSEPDELPAVVRCLDRLHKDKLWIACGCGVEGESLPLLAPVLRAGNITLRRLQGRGAHAQECSFVFEQVEAVSGQPQPGGDASNPVPANPPQFLDPPGASGLAEEEHDVSKGPQKHRRRLSTLARRLMWLMHQSGLQQWPGLSESPARVLLNLAKQMSLGKELTLADFLFCNASFWFDGKMDGALRKTKEAGFGAQALLICPVVAANREEKWVQFVRDGTPQRISGALEITGLARGAEVDSVRFPMLMIGKVLRDDSGDTRLATAYLHPCVALGNWMLVDSNYERQALEQIKRACAYLEKKGFRCTIEKPLFDWRDTGARPDFVVQSSGQGEPYTLVVETMGFNTPDYVEQKQETMRRLSQYRVFEDQRHLQNSEIDGQLWRAVASALRPPGKS